MQSVRSTSLLIPLIALLGACTVGPDYQKPSLNTPAAWTAAGGSVAVSPTELWWREFRDPELDRLIQLALENNVDLQRILSVLEEARAAADEARAGGKPQLSASSAYVWQPGGVGSTRPGYLQQASYGFDASWELDLWGKQRRIVEAAKANVGVAEASVDDARLSLIGEVAKNYMLVRTAQSQRLLLEREKGERAKWVRASQLRQSLGDGTMFEIMQAEAAVLELDAQVTAQQLAEQIGQHALATLCGVPPVSLPPIAAGSLPTAAWPAVGVPADLVRRRPDVRKAERSYAQAVAGIGQAEAARYPAVSIAGSITLNALSFPTLLAQPLLALGPRLTGSVFAFGKIDAQVRQAEERAEQGRLSYRTAILTALQDVEDSLSRLHAAQRTIQNQKKVVAAATKQLQAARLLVVRADGTFTNVIDAQRLLDGARQSLASAQADEAIQTVALFKALGGGWSVK